MPHNICLSGRQKRNKIFYYGFMSLTMIYNYRFNLKRYLNFTFTDFFSNLAVLFYETMKKVIRCVIMNVNVVINRCAYVTGARTRNRARRETNAMNYAVDALAQTAACQPEDSGIK